MTKKEMIKVIKESGMVVDFSESYFNHMLKERVEHFYTMALEYNRRYAK